MTDATSQACGLKYPLQIANGRLVLSSGVQHVKESIAQIIQTLPGEYLFFPEFGCDLKRRVFGPVNATALAKHDILSAVKKWEPRATITDITTETYPSEVGVMRLNVSFTVDGEAEEYKMTTEIRRAAG